MSMNYRYASADKAFKKQKDILEQNDYKIMKKSYGPTVCLINHNKNTKQQQQLGNQQMILSYFLIVLENQRLSLEIQQLKITLNSHQEKKYHSAHQLVRITQQHYSQLKQLKQSMQRQSQKLIEQKNRQIAQKKKVMDDYQMMNQQLKNRLKTMQTNESELINRNNNLQRQIQQLQTSNHKLSLQSMQNSADFQATLDFQKNDINIIKQRNLKLQALLSDHKYLLTSKNQKINDLQSKITLLEQQNNQYPQSTKASTKINTDFSSFVNQNGVITQLKQELSFKNAKIQNLIQQLNFVKEKIDQQARIMNSFTNNQQIYQNQRYEMQKKFNEVFFQKQHLSKKLKKMNQKFQLQQLLLNDKIVGLNESIRRKQQQLLKKDRQITELKNRRLLQKTTKKPSRPFVQDIKQERLQKSYSTNSLMNKTKASQADLKNIMNQVLQLKISNQKMGYLIGNTSHYQVNRQQREYYRK